MAMRSRSLTRWLPGWHTLRTYDRTWLRHDVVAGLVLTTMLVPVGIAYAEASGLPGINGLYATIVPLLAYALFGPSRILVLGPDSALAAVILRSCCRSRQATRSAQSRLPERWPSSLACVCIAAGLAQPGLRDRAALEADPLRLHERHRADSALEPNCRSSSASPSKRKGRCGRSGPFVKAAARGKHQRRDARDRCRHARY